MDSRLKPLFIIFIQFSVGEMNAEMGIQPPYPSGKFWWAKQFYDDHYTSGPLTERHLKLAVDSGIKSIISMFYYAQNKTIGDELWPSTEYTRYFLEDIAGITFHHMLEDGNKNYTTVEVLKNFTSVMQSVQKPVLVFCGASYKSTLISYAYYIQEMKLKQPQPYAEVKVLAKKLSTYGHNYTKGYVKEYLKLIHPDIPMDILIPEAPEVENPDDWSKKGMWFLKPLSPKWFISGQIYSHYGEQISNQNYTVVNFRLGVVSNGQPTQEQVTLLNIHDSDLAFNDIYRQNVNLTNNIIDPAKLNAFISTESDVNYESMNAMEYGDKIGYNETKECDDMATKNVQYIHIPIDPNKPNLSKEDWKQIRDSLDFDVPTVLHCRTGLRAVTIGAALLAEQLGKDSTWAIQKAKDLGYNYGAEEQDLLQVIHDFFEDDVSSDDVSSSSSRSAEGSLLACFFIFLSPLSFLLLASRIN